LEDFAVPELAEEVSVLWGSDDQTPITWDEAYDVINNLPMFNYTVVRRMAQRPLVGPLPNVDDLLCAPAWMLPLLRGKAQQLEAQTQDYLVSCGLCCLGSDLRSGAFVAQVAMTDPVTAVPVLTAPIKYLPMGKLSLEGNAAMAPPIIQLCREFGRSITEELSNMLAAQLPRLTEPKLAAPLVNILLTSWTLP
jgi:hypothetical protein